MIREGLLWYDDSGRELAEKIGQAARRYRRKFGSAPDACYVHPSVLKDNGKSKAVGGIRVTPSPSVLRHHFWLGQEDKKRRRQERG
jgi:hypothetical protein